MDNSASLLFAIQSLWPVFVGCLLLVIWLVRLEMRVSTQKENLKAIELKTEKEMAEIKIKHEVLDSKVVEQLAQVRESLARIEGAMGIKIQQQ